MSDEREIAPSNCLPGQEQLQQHETRMIGLIIGHNDSMRLT